MLHYDAEDLKIPPPEGWPELTQETLAGLKSSYTIEVLRRLPYFNSEADIHYKSELLDYTSHQDRELLTPSDIFGDYCESSEINPVHVIYIASGHESGGRDLLLDVQHGEIIEEELKCRHVTTDDARQYFDALKEAYRCLKLIPCLEKDTIEAWEVEERPDKITEEELRAQTEPWGTKLDVQYLRQLYRQHGWPDAFRKEDCKEAVDELVDSMIDGRLGGWC